jgi:hypothetical protein
MLDTPTFSTCISIDRISLQDLSKRLSPNLPGPIGIVLAFVFVDQ